MTEYTEGSESKSPAYNPPYSVESTESSGIAQTQGQGTTLDFTPIREPERAVDSDSEERADMSMFIAPVAMNCAQIAHSNWMVDSGAGMSGTSRTTTLKDTMRCGIPITPAFGAVMNATSEGLISDPTFKELGIKAIHIEGMHHNLLSVHQLCTEGESGEKQVGIFTSEGCQTAGRHSRLCHSVTTRFMDWWKGEYTYMLLLELRNSNQSTTQGGWRYTP